YLQHTPSTSPIHPFSHSAPLPPHIHTLSLHDALPISACIRVHRRFQTAALVPFLFYQSTRPLGRNLTREAWLIDKREMEQAQLRSEEHTSELQSRFDLVCRLLLEKKKKQNIETDFYVR